MPVDGTMGRPRRAARLPLAEDGDGWLRVGNLTVASYATCVSGFIRKLEIFLQEPDMRGALRGNIAARLAFMFL